MVADWSSNWFAAAVFRPLGVLTGVAPGQLDVGEALAFGDVAAIVARSGVRLALAKIMTDAPAGAVASTGADQEMVADLSAACIDDLADRVIRLFSVPDRAVRSKLGARRLPPIDRPYLVSLGLKPGAPLLDIVVGDDLRIGALKAGLTAPAPALPLAPLPQALSMQVVGLSAAVGRCTLSLADLGALEPGDVLILDSDVEAPVDIVVDDSRAVALGAVERSESGLALRLLHSISG